jgi:hypothetical protein
LSEDGNPQALDAADASAATTPQYNTPAAHAEDDRDTGIRQAEASPSDEEVDPSDPPEATETPRPRERTWWSLPIRIISGTVAVVGAVTGVISIVPILFPDSSGLGSLSVTAGADDSAPHEFALPFAALDSGFPIADVPCSGDQLAWLDEHATSIQRHFMIDMRNSASDGAMLALIDFRADVEYDASAATDVLVVCPTDTASATVKAAALAVDDRKATARFSALTAAGQPVPEIPVAWNLAPGETGRLQIVLTGERGTSGDLVVTALVGGDENTVPIDGPGFQLPGLWQAGAAYLRVGSAGLECVRPVSGDVVACADADLADLAHAKEAAYSRS